METRTDVHNSQSGSGVQNNYNSAGTQNIIAGGEVHFIHNFNPAEPNPLQRLWDAIRGIGASHDAEQQYERGKCLQGTREKVINRIFSWILDPDGPPLLWLTGAAGVGKSAIAMTIAKLSEENGHLVVSFFFFRADPKRNNASALILNIAYGLVTTMPLLRNPIEQRISRDPRILEACMEDQFRELVVKPLTQQPPLPAPKPPQLPLPSPEPLRLPLPKPPKPSFRQRWSERVQKALGRRAPVGIAQRKAPSLVNIDEPDESGNGIQSRTGSPARVDGAAKAKAPHLVIIDGLDECGDEHTQKRILSTIQSAFDHSTSFPLRFLICSRPESWLQHAFKAKPLQPLHERVDLDDSFNPDADIERYYRHHLEEIVSDPKYAQVVFPSPWPSESNLETLIEWTCGQFIYAATVIKFLKHKAKHPVMQLRIILERIPSHKLGSSPYQELDALYNVILIANSDPEETILVLAAILVLADCTSFGHRDGLAYPTVVELVLGLPPGQVALTLHGMHSVLDIRGRGDIIRPFHNSFREYLLDPNRSGSFYIDTMTQKLVIGRLWFQNLSTKKIQSYSSNQLWDRESEPFFKEWVRFCRSIPEPTRDLLDVLWNVDLAAAHAISEYNSWTGLYKDLVPWVRKYLPDSKTGVQEEPSGSRDHPKPAKNSKHLKADGSPSWNNGERAVEGSSREIDNRRDDLDLVEGLVHKFLNRPQCFHLEWPPSVSPPDDVVDWIVDNAAGCSEPTRLAGSRPSGSNNVRLTECSCDLSGGKESRNRWHVAYQEACLKLVQAYVSLFEELSQGGAEGEGTMRELRYIFLNLTNSPLLIHCRVDMELVTLCRTFFGLAKGCLSMRIHPYKEEQGPENMLKWFETFPDRFAAEGEALEAQVLDLPWERWRQNW